MLDTPHISTVPAQQAATIHLVIPRDQIQQVMGPAIQEVIAALAAQGLRPQGPMFSYHYRRPTDTFDFEVGFPVAGEVKAEGRVAPFTLPASKVARVNYVGPYEGLGEAWGNFIRWLEAEKLDLRQDMWERYVTGPEAGTDPSKWVTELNMALKD